jgi:AAA ATPase domain/Protein of unknown function (DUF3696)
MLTAIRVGNFKAFSEAQTIPLRPLTLIFGANSSGKSSILHSLIFARHAQDTGELDVHRTNVGGESVDLGGFRQFVHRRDVNRRMEWSAELDTASFTGRMAGLLAPVKRLMVSISVGIALDDQGKPLQEASPEMDAYEVFGDDRSLMRMSKRRDGKLQLDRLDHEHPLFREVIKAIVETSTTTESLQTSDYEGLSEAVTEVVPQVTVSVGKFLPEGLEKSDAFTPAAQPALFPVSHGRRKEDLAAAVRFFIPRILDELLRGINVAVYEELTNLQYLGPLRSYPPRHLAFSQHHDPNWQAGGGYAWDEVRRNARVRDKVNAWLSAPGRLQTPYTLILKDFIHERGFDNEIYDGLEEVLKQINPDDVTDDFDKTGVNWYEPKLDRFADVVGKTISNSQADRLHELVLIDNRTHTAVSHRDVGIGVSQVLPVLVGAYGSKSRIIAIEQPEIHLHPALQADLGDVFIQSALGENNNRFLIETHSEHVILRILRRIRETTDGELAPKLMPIRPEEVAVLYVSPTKDGCKVIEIPINSDGEFAEPWPDGFFPERAKELF